VRTADKAERKQAETEALEATMAEMAIPEDDTDTAKQAGKAFKAVLKEMMRDRVVDEGIRLDGRSPADIRPLSAEVGVIERAHGSAIFQRGETQVMNITTLG